MARRLSGTNAIPARRASAVLRKAFWSPATASVPWSGLSLPNRARASSSWPQPMKP